MISTILRIDRNVNGRKQKNMLLLFYCTVIALALVSDTAADSILSICPPRHWISAQVDACVPCSTCTEADRIVVLRPCQLHQDTVCGTLNDLEFEWNNLLQHRHIGHDRPQSATDRTAATAAAASASLLASSSAAVVVTRTWEWQASSMAFAAIACLLFVSALVYILYQHAKQWRHMENMERRFDRDVEQLSAQLMHNIVDLRSIDPTGSANVTSISSRNPLTHQHPLQQATGNSNNVCGAIIVPGQRQQHHHHHHNHHQNHHLHHVHVRSLDDAKTTKQHDQVNLGGGTTALIMPCIDHGTTAAVVAATTTSNTASAVESMSPPNGAGAVGSGGSGELRCVYLEQLLVGASPMRGNVYTEETKPLPSAASNKKAPHRAPAMLPSGSTSRLNNNQQQQHHPHRVNTNNTNGISAMGLHRMQSAFGKK